MIYENDNPISETRMSKLRKETVENYPQFQKQGFVILKYASHMVAPNKDNPGMVDQPQSVILRCVQNVTTPEGAKQFRYAVSAVTKGKGEVTYDPSAISVDRQIMINDIDLLVFLHNFCPLVAGSLNVSANIVPLLVIEDQLKEAVVVTSKRRDEADYLNLLYNKLNHAQLELMATAYGVAGADDMEAEVLRERIDALVKRSRGGASEFLMKANFNDPDESSKVTGITKLKDAVDLEIVVFNASKKRWDMVTPTKELIKTLHTSGKPNIPALYAHLAKYEPEILDVIATEVSARLQES